MRTISSSKYVCELQIRLKTDDTRLEGMFPVRWAAVLTHRLKESRAKAAMKRDRHQRWVNPAQPPVR